jgi:hypothetical protein
LFRYISVGVSQEVQLLLYFKMKFYSRILALCLLFELGSLTQVSAQIISYKRNALEFKAGVGGTMFFGDLGGSHGEGKDGFFDYDVQSMRATTSFGLKFNLTNKISIRTDVCFAQVMGSDAYSGDPSRFDRNLSFKSDIYELSFTPEFVLHFARLGRKKTATSEIYGFVGFGILQLNPQAELNGVWYDLQPLGKEGQGLRPGTELYSLQSWVVTFGVGYRKNIGRKSYLGIELSMRKSFTDYIDDVSTDYYNTDALFEERGETAALLSDRSLSEPAQSFSGRGNPKSNDNYSFIQLTYSRSIGKQDASASKNEKFFFRLKGKEKCPAFH